MSIASDVVYLQAEGTVDVELQWGRMMILEGGMG